MPAKTATLILNRNLKSATEAAYEQLMAYDAQETDIYIVESGSDEVNLPKYPHWWANWPEARRDGLRYPRGFNFGLCRLIELGLYDNYDYFFLLCNDIEFPKGPVIGPLVQEMQRHPRMGILSPLSPEWGEKELIPPNETRYFWHIVPDAWLVRRKFIDAIRETEKPNFLNLLFDGTNFRGYGTEMELTAKAYANDWAAGITSTVVMTENENLLLNRADLIRTDPWEESLKLAAAEGSAWMRRKYGFNSRWSMQMYVKFFYDKFFQLYPESERYRIL